MGLISGTLLGPVRFLAWTAERILEAADAQRYDPQAVLAALARLNDDHDRGVIDDDAFASAEDDLMARLAAARARGGPRS